MKKTLLALMCMVSITASAFDHSYNASGENENGDALEGVIYSDNRDQHVYGELEDENGNTHDFNGYWNGYGRISGEIDDGTTVDLNTA